jgi:hypothetical protein
MKLQQWRSLFTRFMTGDQDFQSIAYPGKRRVFTCFAMAPSAGNSPAAETIFN